MLKKIRKILHSRTNDRDDTSRSVFVLPHTGSALLSLPEVTENEIHFDAQRIDCD
jgi:hypothetical protein